MKSITLNKCFGLNRVLIIITKKGSKDKLYKDLNSYQDTETAYIDEKIPIHYLPTILANMHVYERKKNRRCINF